MLQVPSHMHKYECGSERVLVLAHLEAFCFVRHSCFSSLPERMFDVPCRCRVIPSPAEHHFSSDKEGERGYRPRTLSDI